MHRGYAASLGIDLENVQPAVATTAYVEFLLHRAWHSGIGETIAAMTPCMRLYAYLGTELARAGDPGPDHPYRDWIATYSGAEFQGLANRLEFLLDRFAEDTPAVRDAYRYAMRCELDFFDSAWRGA
jgi:thiaminase/transcriptional activator TenA